MSQQIIFTENSDGGLAYSTVGLHIACCVWDRYSHAGGAAVSHIEARIAGEREGHVTDWGQGAGDIRVRHGRERVHCLVRKVVCDVRFIKPWW